MASIRRRHNRESFRAWHERKVGEREQRERQMDYGWFLFSCVLSFHYFSQRLLAQDDSSRRCQAPASLKSWTVSAADKDVVVHVPNGRLARGRVEQCIIRLAPAIEVRHIHQAPASRQSRTIGTPEKSVVVQIPQCCLMRADVLKNVVRFAVAIKVDWIRRRYWTSLRAVSSTGVGLELE